MSQQSLVEEATRKYQRDGLYVFFKAVIQYAYSSLIRPFLPGQRQEIRGIAVGGDVMQRKIFDELLSVGWPQDHKKPNCELITRYVDDGDDVIVIGGGFGITTVVSATRVGATGSVVVYEGAQRYIEILRETIELNGVQEQTIVEHAVVGTAVDLKGSAGNADTISPDELSCDVLEMDCEGAERTILEQLSELPTIIIVETHPKKGCSTSQVEQLLEQKGYDVLEKRPDRVNGHVLAARKSPSSERL